MYLASRACGRVRWPSMPPFTYRTTTTADQVDVMGHLNNAAYLAIFEAARWAVLTETGVRWEELTRLGVGPVILDVALRFRREVGAGQALVVETTYEPRSPRRFTVQQRMLDPEGGVRATATLSSGFLHVASRRLVDAPPELLAALGIDPATVPAAPVVQGLGGAFLYADDVDALAAWYRDRLGLALETWGKSRGIELPSADLISSNRLSTTTFALFQADAPLPPQRTGRVNFRVGDLDGLLDRCRAAGDRVERLHDDYGRFAWVWDPEGNIVELWEPPVQA